MRNFGELIWNDPKVKQEWVISVQKWDEEWRNGEMAEKRTNIQKALELGRNFTDDIFVTEFLHSKGITQLSTVTNQTVEQMLRQALAEIDVDRVRELEQQYRKTKKNEQQIKDLQKEIEALQKLLNSQSIEYTQMIRYIEDNIEKRADTLKRLKEVLNNVVEKNNETNEECSRIYTETENLLTLQRSELNDYSLSFSRNISEMTKNKSTITIIVLKRAKWPVIIGIVLGGGVGCIIPRTNKLVGMGVGATTGAVVGLASTVVLHWDDDRYRETLESARREQMKLDKLLNEDE